MPGNPAEPLWVELTNETLTYIRSAMIYQMQQGVKKKRRAAADGSDQVELSDVQSVTWSYSRQRYRAVHVIPDSGKCKRHYAKSLGAAMSFVETGIKCNTTIEGDDRADDEGHENDVDSRANSDGEGQCSGEADGRADFEGDESDVETPTNDDDAVRASAAESCEDDEHTDN
jgi:hypothetical protein